jgi:hypothetical protein
MFYYLYKILFGLSLIKLGWVLYERIIDQKLNKNLNKEFQLIKF